MCLCVYQHGTLLSGPMTDVIQTNRVKELAARFDAWEAANEQRDQPTLITVTRKRSKTQAKDEEEDEADDEGGEDVASDSEGADEESEGEDEEGESEEGGESGEESGDENENEAEDEEQAPKPAAEVATDNKQTDQSNVLVTEEGDEIAKFRLPETDIQASATLIGMPVEKVKTYNNGVTAYAFVKQNSGMLKPVKLFFQPKLGRLFIVRKKDDQIHSLYIHIDYFEEIDCLRGAMAYLARNTTDQVLLSTVTDLEAMPHMVLWTNDKFNNKEGGSTVKSWFRRKKPVSRRSLVFIFEDNQKRDILLDLLVATAPFHPVKSIAAKRASDYQP